MKPDTLLEVLDAAHLSCYVDAPFNARGGIMIVGPPGVMKSSFIEAAFDEYPNALVLSDINVNTFTDMKDDLVSGRYRTIGFTAYEKLYQRATSTAKNVEGMIMALVEEGFTRASFEDQRMAALRARAFICGAMPYSFYSQRFKQWVDSGFARRFLWVFIRLQDPHKIQDAIHKWELIPMDSIARREPKTRKIKYTLTEAESNYLRGIIKEQPGDATPYVLMKKLYCCLKWKHESDKKAMEIMKDFRLAVTKQGAEIEL